MRCLGVLAAAVGLSLVGAAVLWADAAPGEKDAPPRVTLMGLMEEWRYPEAKMPQGATMAGGDSAGVYPMRCEAVLTTPDDVAKVIAFYEKAFKIDAEGKGAQADGRHTASLNDSKGRGVTVRMFSAGSADATVTVVVSRGADEKETHIAWTEFLRLPVVK